jgi:hypothetical protein
MEMRRYNVDWQGPEGLSTATHQPYLDQLIRDFNRAMLKLIERGIRNLDLSPQVVWEHLYTPLERPSATQAQNMKVTAT